MHYFDGLNPLKIERCEDYRTARLWILLIQVKVGRDDGGDLRHRRHYD